MYRMEKPSPHGRERKVNSAAVLVYEAFVGKIPHDHYVQYKDGNRRNLAASNLYLKSNSEFDEWIFGSCMEGLVCVR